MNIAHTLVNVLFDVKNPPPPGGFIDDLPEAFGALDEKGEVFIIGYKGEWYTPIKPSIKTRIHNWLVAIGNRKEEERDSTSQ